MNAKQAHEHVRKTAMACPCCGQPLVLAVEGWTSEPPPEVRDWLILGRALREQGLLVLDTAEAAAEQIGEGQWTTERTR